LSHRARRDPIITGSVVAHVERRQDALGVPPGASLEQAGVTHRGGAHDHRVSAGAQPGIHRFGRADSSGDLNFQVMPAHYRLDYSPVVVGSAGGIQVDHVKVLGSRCHEFVHHLERIVRIHGRLPVVTFDQADAAPAEKVDGWNDDHSS
jgi:hypothetical protein